MLVLGATSGIAQATVRLLALQGWHFILAGRDMGALQKVAAEVLANVANLMRKNRPCAGL